MQPAYNYLVPTVIESGERLDRGRETFPLEAASHERDHPRIVRDVDLGTGLGTMQRSIPWMKAIEIHPVVDDRHAVGVDAVQTLDLALSSSRNRDGSLTRNFTTSAPPVIRNGRSLPEKRRAAAGSTSSSTRRPTQTRTLFSSASAM